MRQSLKDAGLVVLIALALIGVACIMHGNQERMTAYSAQRFAEDQQKGEALLRSLRLLYESKGLKLDESATRDEQLRQALNEIGLIERQSGPRNMPTKGRTPAGMAPGNQLEPPVPVNRSLPKPIE